MTILSRAEALKDILGRGMAKGESSEAFHIARELCEELQNRDILFHPGVAVGLCATILTAGVAMGRHVQRLDDEQETGRALGR